MAGIRDPAFWRRFSMAAHLEASKSGPFVDSSSSTVDLTKTPSTTSSSASSSRPKLEHSDSWLQRHHAKRKRARIIGWLIAMLVLILIAGIAVACWWLSRHGWEFWKEGEGQKKLDDGATGEGDS
ncbi:MAG: hypothetical protein Q9160_008190 [Pyrenula sp. 1 TL-2023]